MSNCVDSCRIYTARLSPALNENSEIRRLERHKCLGLPRTVPSCPLHTNGSVLHLENSGCPNYPMSRVPGPKCPFRMSYMSLLGHVQSPRSQMSLHIPGYPGTSYMSLLGLVQSPRSQMSLHIPGYPTCPC